MAGKSYTVTMHDGTTHEVIPTIEDTLAFETTLRKNKGWGPLQDNALKMAPFRAWNALKRAGKTDLTWTEFTTGDTAALDVTPTEEPDEEPDDDGSEEVAGVGKAGRRGRSTAS